MHTDQGPKILITGGSGFLGRGIIRELLLPDAPFKPAMIRSFDLVDYGHSNDHRVQSLRGNICNYEEMRSACQGMDLVIHTAAIVDWGTRTESEVYAVNVGGTENVIRACKEAGVKALIQTSSLDAVFAGKPLLDVDERLPYPEKHPNMYCRSKYLSEQLTLAENSAHFRTCALRPADIYGEADPYHIDSLVDMAKTGFYIRLGNGSSRSQHVYLGNMAHAHLLAARALLEGNSKIGGQVYFITDGPGHNFFSFFDQIVFGAGYRVWPRNLWLPRWFAYSLGSISEGIAYLLRPIKHYHPKLSRFAVTYTCTDFTFSAEKATRDFGFQPKYAQAEALERTIRYYRKKRESKYAAS